jgi:hypothetical protein
MWRFKHRKASIQYQIWKVFSSPKIHGPHGFYIFETAAKDVDSDPVKDRILAGSKMNLIFVPYSIQQRLVPYFFKMLMNKIIYGFKAINIIPVMLKYLIGP